MLYPLFGKECDLVGWIAPGQHIFSTNMSWVAYISGNQAWAADSGDWLGAIRGFTFLDRAGCPVAWNPNDPLLGTARPARPARAARMARPAAPARPATPPRPARPPTPAGGWSKLSFFGWLAQ